MPLRRGVWDRPRTHPHWGRNQCANTHKSETTLKQTRDGCMFDLMVKKLPYVLFPRVNVTTAHRIKLCGRFRNMTSSKFGCCISSIDTISCTVCRGYTTT